MWEFKIICWLKCTKTTRDAPERTARDFKLTNFKFPEQPQAECGKELLFLTNESAPPGGGELDFTKFLKLDIY